SGDVERVRIGEDAGIAVRGGQDGGDRLADVDRLPRELGGPPAYPGRELNRGFQSEDLVDRIRPQTRIRLEDVELVRMRPSSDAWISWLMRSSPGLRRSSARWPPSQTWKRRRPISVSRNRRYGR